jgi:hypothetical protein
MDKDQIEQRWDGTMGQTAISCTDRKRPGSLPELRLTLLLDRLTFWLGFDILPIMRAVARVPNVAIRFENYTGGRAGVDQLSSLEYSQKNRDDLQQLLGTTELMYAKGLLRVNVRPETSTLEFKFKYRVADLKIERHRENHSAKCVHCHARKTYLGKLNLGVLGKR